MNFRCAAAGLLCKAVDNPNFGLPCIECGKVAHAECGESFYHQSTTNITANQLSSQGRHLVDVYAQSHDNAILCVNCIIDIQRRIAAKNNTHIQWIKGVLFINYKLIIKHCVNCTLIYWRKYLYSLLWKAQNLLGIQ